MLNHEDDHGEGTCRVNATSTSRVKIEVGGEGVVAHVGLHALGAFADQLGLGEALSERIPPPGERLWLHDRGKVLVQAMLMLTGGGKACTDIEVLSLLPWWAAGSVVAVARPSSCSAPGSSRRLASGYLQAGSRPSSTRRSTPRGTIRKALEPDVATAELQEKVGNPRSHRRPL